MSPPPLWLTLQPCRSYTQILLSQSGSGTLLKARLASEPMHPGALAKVPRVAGRLAWPPLVRCARCRRRGSAPLTRAMGADDGQVPDGTSPQQVAKLMGVSPGSVYGWVKRLSQEGHAQALADRPRSGRPPQLSARHQKHLRWLLSHSPQEFGFLCTEWTVAVLRAQLQREGGPEVSEDTLRAALHRLGYVWKRPRRAHHRGRAGRGDAGCRPGARHGVELELSDARTTGPTWVLCEGLPGSTVSPSLASECRISRPRVGRAQCRLASAGVSNDSGATAAPGVLCLPAWRKRPPLAPGSLARTERRWSRCGSGSRDPGSPAA
jgi:transposase